MEVMKRSAWFWVGGPSIRTDHGLMLVVEWWDQNATPWIALARELASFSEASGADGSMHRFDMCAEWVLAEAYV